MIQYLRQRQMLSTFEQFTEEDWELLGLCMIYDVYRIRYPRLDELLMKLERRENETYRNLR